MDIQLHAAECAQGRQKYAAVILLSSVCRMLETTDWNEIPSELSPQRPASKPHARTIKLYAEGNPETWNLPPLSVAVVPVPGGEKISFHRIASHPFGRLTIPSSAKIFPIDGQHRLIAIRLLELSKQFPDFATKSITIEIHVDLTLTERQDLFITLNTAKKVPKQITLSIGQNKEMRFARRVANESEGFVNMIEKNRSSVPKNSLQLFTISQLFDAVMPIANPLLMNTLANEINHDVEDTILALTNMISISIPTYKMVRDGDITAKETCLACNSFFLQAIFRAAFQLNQENKVPLKTISNGLKVINWQVFTGSSINPVWEKYLLPLPSAKIVRSKANRDEITRIIIDKIMRLS